MRRVIIEPEAESDLATACDWFAIESATLKERFIIAVGAAIEKARERPTSFPYVHSMTRRVLADPFAYAVLFQDHTDSIIVLGVMHTSMHPERFLRRSR